MEHGRIGVLRQYLLLSRLPNVFTAPPDVAAGYLATTPLAQVDWLALASLMSCSALVYVGGIVLNDYFDIGIDKRERPERPLPSGSIPRRNALIIAVLAISAANLLALPTSTASFAVTAALTLSVFGYDYYLKKTSAAPVAMAAARFLNIILGASIGLGQNTGLALPILYATLLFAYIVAIMMFSKKEVGYKTAGIKAPLFIIVAIVVSMVVAAAIAPLEPAFLLYLAGFAGCMFFIFRRIYSSKWPASAAVKHMVLLIILLDSVFVAGSAGILAGAAVLALIVPATILAKTLYVT